MDEQSERNGTYPIGVVSRRTGLSAEVLRAWERRYGVAVPSRAAGGARLYSAADVARLSLLARAVAAGHTIGQIAARSSDEIESMLARPAAPARSGRPDEAERSSGLAIESYVTATLAAVRELDDVRVHGILTRAAVVLRGVEFAEGVVAPVLRRVGELWAEGELCPAHEHMLSAVVRRVLSWLLDNLAVPEGAPRAVVSTPKGHAHELAALMAAVRAAESGWRITYLGPDLPAGDIANAAATTEARAVLLSVVRESGGTDLLNQLRDLRGSLAPDVALLVGGAGGQRQRREIAGVGAVWVADLRSLADRLQEIDPRPQTMFLGSES